MAFERHMILPFQTGLQTDVKPFLILDDAFAQLNNAYVFRGRVRKRFGGQLMSQGYSNALEQNLFSRFSVPLGSTDGGGNASATAPGSIFKQGQMFSIGDQLFTVQATGTPVTMLNTGAGTGTYNTTTGAYVFTGVTAGTQIIFYPAEPVMGLTVYESGPINNQPSYGFDTQFAYTFNGNEWTLSGTTTAPRWHGGNLNFFWTTNWRGATPNVTVLFATNYHVVNPNGLIDATNDDFIWYTTNGSTWTKASGANGFYFAPAGGADHTGPYIVTARIILPFKGSLLLLNVVESDGTNNFTYGNRCRWSFDGSPFANNAWYQDSSLGGSDNGGLVGEGGGFTDASTEEQIISAEFIKDRLIVYFERSTWELVSQNNPVEPFKFQKINTELGVESQQSVVPFDKFVVGIGNSGVHACNGQNVERIDNKIPDKIFQINDKNIGVQRVAGIRDYFTELVYWAFPSIGQNANEVYPTKVLVYNYKNGTWAFNDDCITSFGYFEQQIATTWANSTPLLWEEANQTWDSGTNATQFRQVIAGNQQGYVFIVTPDEVSRNAPVMQLSNTSTSSGTTNLTIRDHTLNVGDYILIENAQGLTGINGNIYQVRSLIAVGGDGGINTVSIQPIPSQPAITGTYLGGGTVTRVSNIQILSKQWNPYANSDRNVYISKIDFFVMTTTNGQLTVQYFPSSTELDLVNEGSSTGTGAIVGNNILETFPYTTVPLEAIQERVWHPVYFQGDGECIQIYISMSDTQIRTPNIAFEDFELHGMVLYTMPTADRMT